MARLPLYAIAIVCAGLVVWLAPFFLTGWSKTPPERRDRRWRWGLLLEIAGFLIAGLGDARATTLQPWRVALSLLFFVLASLLSWTSARTLGRFLRFEAALDADHQLVRTGPYRIVRHPIYASMLCAFLAIATMAARPLYVAVGLVLFLAGTEIRVQIEDALLADYFGSEFRDYQRTTPAYIPLLR
jgi:protein-S-isoprenylcysteine O-methyltransferase Ste14